MIEKSSNPESTAPGKGVSRRSVVKAAAWSTPIIAASISAPLAAASVTREFGIQSNFGVGWYPSRVNQTSSGALQYDCANRDKYLRITGTEPGDTITNVYVDVYVSTDWPVQQFTPLAGSNPQWSTLSYTGSDAVVNGRTWRIYRTSFTGTVAGMAGSTEIPIGFYFRASSPYYGGYVQTHRFATVNGKPVSLVRTPTQVVNTNVPVSAAPRP